MSIIGKVESLWRYPVKSMQGEELDEVFMGFSGIYGDRLFALKSSACAKGFAVPKGFPTSRGENRRECFGIALGSAIPRRP